MFDKTVGAIVCVKVLLEIFYFTKTIVMKRKVLLAIAISIFLTSVLSAQIEKKDWLFGGSLGINVNNGNNGNSASNSNTSIAPHLAYALGKNSVIGLNFNFGYSTSAYDLYNLGLATNLMYKKFFLIKNKFGWYAQLIGGVGWGENSSFIYDSLGNFHKGKSNYYTYNIGFVPGVYYHISPGVLINADCGGVGYNYTRSPSLWSSNIFVNFLTTFSFGVDFIITKHKS
jgi:hypothetical protein